MKKRLTKMLAIVITVAVLCVNFLPFVAGATTSIPIDGGVSPRLSNCHTCSFTFTVIDPNLACVGVTYVANENYFTFARLTVKIQKKVLGLFWSTVDIGEPNNEWVSDCYYIDGDFYNEFTVDGNGTYRAVIKAEFHGNSGTTDVIEDTIEVEY